jgi:IS30 family transposase
MSSYKQLTQEQRYGIYSLLKIGLNQTAIAETIGVHKSTISRELKRNTGKRGYRYQQAHALALSRRKAKYKPRIDADTWAFIETLLRLDWSPEQIQGWMKYTLGYTVSHEWIYHYVLHDKNKGGDLYLHLRCQKKKKKRYGAKDRRGQLKDRVSIEHRPQVVESRTRIGDWEADTMIGKRHQQVLVTLVERKSRYTLIRKVKRKTKTMVRHALIDLLTPWKGRVHTITKDNGKEFADHKAVATALEADIYFAHPYSSWERGLNENTNGLIRQYFPKHRDFTSITEAEVNHVMERLNHRPRKCLGYQTPAQVFSGNTSTVAFTT